MKTLSARMLAAAILLLCACTSCHISSFTFHAIEIGSRYQAVEITPEEAKTVYKKNDKYYIKANLAEYERIYPFLFHPFDGARSMCRPLYKYRKISDENDPGKPGYYLLNYKPRDPSHKTATAHYYKSPKDPSAEELWIPEEEFDLHSAQKVNDLEVELTRCGVKPEPDFTSAILPIKSQNNIWHYIALPLVPVGFIMDGLLMPVGGAITTGEIANHLINDKQADSPQ